MYTKTPELALRKPSHPGMPAFTRYFSRLFLLPELVVVTLEDNVLDVDDGYHPNTQLQGPTFSSNSQGIQCDVEIFPWL